MRPFIRAFNGGFATNTGESKAVSHRYLSELSPLEKLCPGCDKIQPIRLFEGLGERFTVCALCRARQKKTVLDKRGGRILNS